MTASIAVRFNEVARAHPGLPAVIGPSGSVTYARLSGAAAAVSARLKPGHGRVALRIDDGAKMIAAILGVLAAGKTYVPLDPAYPAERLHYMASDCGAETTLTDADVEFGRAGRLEPVAGEDAYILYTSGSTGRPKGVVQTQRNVLHQALGHIERLRITPSDRVSVLSSFSYDMAVTDAFSALLSGAAAVPVPVRTAGMAELREALVRHGVTIYHSTPTVFRHLLETVSGRGLPSIRAVVLGGEKVNRSDVEAARAACSPELVFVNGYGATEISFVAQHHLRPGDEIETVIVPIGRPLPGCEIELSEAGEIVVTSAHLARYWGMPDGFTELPGGRRRYPTGDLGQWLPDGSLAYLGRSDRQIKFSGYRIEPAEIEHALVAEAGVREAAVRMVGETLVAYVVAAPPVEAAQLRRALGRTLPPFMIPARIVPLDALPLTPTGKVDLAALPEPAGVESTVDGGLPETPLERRIAAAWCTVLGMPEVGRQVSFFDAGGGSLHLARLQQELELRLGTRIPLTDMFAHPTVAAMAGHLSGRAGGGASAAVLDRMQRRKARR